MFNLEQAISDWRRQMTARGIKAGEVLDELESHLRDEVERQVGLGAGEQAAFEAAVACVGEGNKLAAEFRKAGKKHRFLKAGYFAFAALVFGINAWTLLSYDLSGAQRTVGFIAISLICLYLASVLSLIKWIPVSAFRLVATLLKALSWLVALWPVYALMEALHILHFNMSMVASTVLWCLYAAGAMTVIAFGFYEKPGWVGGSGGPLSPPAGPTGRPIPPEGPVPPELPFSVSASSPLDSDVRQSFQAACREANRLGHDFVGTEHVLLGLLQVANGRFANILRRLNLNQELVRVEVERLVHPTVTDAAKRVLKLTPRANKAVKLAAHEAKSLSQPRVAPEHLFAGLLLEGSGIGALVLQKLGIDVARIRREGLRELPDERASC